MIDLMHGQRKLSLSCALVTWGSLVCASKVLFDAFGQIPGLSKGCHGTCGKYSLILCVCCSSCAASCVGESGHCNWCQYVEFRCLVLRISKSTLLLTCTVLLIIVHDQRPNMEPFPFLCRCDDMLIGSAGTSGMLSIRMFVFPQ